MLTFILRRAALIVPTFIGVTLLAFALIHLIPGDPVENLRSLLPRLPRPSGHRQQLSRTPLRLLLSYTSQNLW